jgi:PPE-repeat protein
MTDAPEALPPEVNSSLVHGGDGPISLEQAAVAFAEAAATDAANAEILLGILESVRSQWDGDTADRYAASLQPLVVWFQSLAANGAASAEQVQAAAASIAQAIATSPHPVQVTTNRTTWGALASTNFFGVNFPPMGVLDGHYMEMWFQAAFARGSSDIETEVATTSLVPFEPPPIPVNIGAMGAPVAGAVSMSSFMAPLGVGQSADLGVSEVGWDSTMAAGAAGDGVGMAGNRPNSSWAGSANQTTNQQQNKLQDASQHGTQDMTQFMSQAGSMAGQAGQLPAQAVQALTQPAQQVGQLPQQFSSILQPLMSSANMGHGLGGLDGAGVPMMPMNFASGTGNLSAALTRPASLGGGFGGVGGSGLRLPGSALAAAAEPGLSGTGVAKLTAAETGAASPGGTGFMGTPRSGSSSGQKNPKNRYESNSLGIDVVHV